MKEVKPGLYNFAGADVVLNVELDGGVLGEGAHFFIICFNWYAILNYPD